MHEKREGPFKKIIIIETVLTKVGVRLGYKNGLRDTSLSHTKHIHNTEEELIKGNMNSRAFVLFGLLVAALLAVSSAADHGEKINGEETLGIIHNNTML